MFKNLNNKKVKNNDENLNNKYNINKEFKNIFEKVSSKNKMKQKPINFDQNFNIKEKYLDEKIDTKNHNILNDSLENDSYEQANKESSLDDENIDIDELYTSIISNKIKSIADRNNSINKKNSNVSYNSISNKISNINSIISTQQKTNSKRNYNDIKYRKDYEIISEFKYEQLINTNGTDNIVHKINKNITFFKNWLSSINLSFYYENFINNDIYEIKQLIEISKTKTRQEIFSYINSILKTNKIGHIYRILIKIDIDTGFIDNNLSTFLSPKKLPSNNYKNNSNYTDNELLISGIKDVFCTNRNEEKSNIQLFFEKYNIKNLYTNFLNNGFDILEYIILQMFSRFPINDYILEKNMYIDDNNDRKKILAILNNEVNKINKMMNSEEYLCYTINRRIKYEDFFLSSRNSNFFIFNNDDRCDFCRIF